MIDFIIASWSTLRHLLERLPQAAAMLWFWHSFHDQATAHQPCVLRHAGQAARLTGGENRPKTETRARLVARHHEGFLLYPAPHRGPVSASIRPPWR